MKKWDEIKYEFRRRKRDFSECLKNDWLMCRWVSFLAIGQAVGILTTACFWSSSAVIVISGMLLGLLYFWFYERAFEFSNCACGLLSGGHEYTFVPAMTLVVPTVIKLTKGLGAANIPYIIAAIVILAEINYIVSRLAYLMNRYTKADGIVSSVFLLLHHPEDQRILSEGTCQKIRDYYGLQDENEKTPK